MRNTGFTGRSKASKNKGEQHRNDSWRSSEEQVDDAKGKQNVAFINCIFAWQREEKSW